MPFDRLPDGTMAILCTRNQRGQEPCRYCGRTKSKLCDFPVIKGKGTAAKQATCDAPLCDRCATRIPGLEDRDLCRVHVPLWDFEKNVPKVGPGAPVAKD